MESKAFRQVAMLNAFVINTASINVPTVRPLTHKPAGYGVDNWLWDDGSNMFWDNEGVVLTDK